MARPGLRTVRSESSTYKITNTELLTTLLEVAYMLGSRPSSMVEASAQAILGLQHSDTPNSTGEQARGTIRLGTKDASFVIMSPSIAMRTIVITITVGPVKVTIIVKW